MSRTRVLITGGAGFVGSHLADELLRHGYAVRALDSLTTQVHGSARQRPTYLDDRVELVVDDVCAPHAAHAAMQDVDAIVHFAATVGVGQSMEQPARYTDVNALGTARVLEAALDRGVPRLLLASSMSVYGEGAYEDAAGRRIDVRRRPDPEGAHGPWDPLVDGRPLRPVPTDESKPLDPLSIYALSKLYQERSALLLGAASPIGVTALRFFNVFGPRQALNNPYTGVLAIFAARYLAGEPPLVFEDGEQRRDFVAVRDVARACRMALESSAAAGEVFNVCSGRDVSIREIADLLANAMGIDEPAPRVTRTWRDGDVRHCFGTPQKAHRVLGWRAETSLEDGLAELVDWLGEGTPDDRIGGDRPPARRARITVPPRPGAIDGNGDPGRDGQRRSRGREAALVLGGAGFIGTNLAARLLCEGRRVIVFDDLSRRGARDNLDWLTATFGSAVEVRTDSIRDSAAVQDAVARATTVYHLAAQVAVTKSLADPRRDFEINVDGTLRVLEALRALADPPPLVFTSTNKVYGPMHDLTVSDDGDRCRPDDPVIRRHGISESRGIDFYTPYGCSKGAAEQYVLDFARNFGLRTIVFRMSCVYGPHQNGSEDQGWVAHLLRRALGGQPLRLFGDGRQVRDVLYVHDLIDAFLAARDRIDELSGRAFNIGGGVDNTLSLLEFLGVIERRFGVEPRVEHHPPRAADQRYYASDIRAFARATGWRPRVDADEGLERLARWLRDAAPAPSARTTVAAGGRVG